jgi:uncharacterized protein (DUF302 family)
MHMTAKLPRSIPSLLAVAMMAIVVPAFARAPQTTPQDQDATTGTITMESSHSFQQTVSRLKSAVSKGGMMVMAEVDQGRILSMTGAHLSATLFLVGNPRVGKQLFDQNPAVGLYVPFRVFVYEGKDGKTYVSYEKASSLLGQFHNQQIDKVAGMLDQKLENLVHMTTQG